MNNEIIGNTSILDIEHYVYEITGDNYGCSMKVSKPDMFIVKAWGKKKKKTNQTILHAMIGQATKCWDEKHDFQISQFEERIAAAEHIISLYFERYGRLRVVKKNSDA